MDDVHQSPYGDLRAQGLAELQSSFDTRELLWAVEDLNRFCAQWKRELRDDLLAVHNMAHTVINGAPPSAAPGEESLPGAAYSVGEELREWAGIPRSSDSSGGAKRRLGARLAAAFRRLRACRTASNTNPDTIQYQIRKRCDILSRFCRSAKSAATAAIARSSLASRVMGRNSTQPVANHPKDAKTRQADRRIINNLQTA